MSPRLFKWLLRLYPRAWRERYADEFEATLDAYPRTSVSVVLDILRGVLDAHLHPRALAPRAVPATGPRVSTFDKFTPRSRHVLGFAQEEARQLRHAHIGTEHLLLGLLRERDGVAAYVLGDLGIDVERARAAIDVAIRGGWVDPTARSGLTPRAKVVLRLSVEEARALGHDFVGTEHLLLGLVREGAGVGAEVLRSLSPVRLDEQEVRLRVLRTLQTPPPWRTHGA